MKLTIVFTSALVAAIAHADDKRIVPTDALGNRQSHKPSYVLKDDGRILAEDAFGNRQTQSQEYVKKGDTIYQADAYGRAPATVG